MNRTLRQRAPFSAQATQGGFTLLEVLIAIVVLSIGLLGLAGLQAAGLRNNQGAYLRTIATQQAYDMADRIRANPLGAGTTAGSYDNISGTGSDPGCIASGCTPVAMAQYDAYEWNTANQDLLPAGQGTVKRTAANRFTITVMWDDARTGAAGVECGSDPKVDLTCFSVSLQP
ncbi:MAG: type IV pilus modification protein PilV [Gammaproteobacteria bacterium]|jgi:type IV pilus assembly protein PilV|nr:type IV pilus modification protein PilV [Gammaproteobacteria bacterium]